MDFLLYWIRICNRACLLYTSFMTDDDDRHPQYKGSSHVIEETILYLEEHYADDIELKGIADQVHVNTSYLSSLFKKETSMTFSQYLNMIRLNQSVKLLKTTEMCIRDSFDSVISAFFITIIY